MNEINMDSSLEYEFRNAAASGEYKTVEDLLNQGINVHCRDWHGDTALHYASRCGYFDIVKLLLKHGARSDVQDEFGRTPKYYADLNGYNSISFYLSNYQEVRSTNSSAGSIKGSSSTVASAINPDNDEIIWKGINLNAMESNILEMLALDDEPVTTVDENSTKKPVPSIATSSDSLSFEEEMHEKKRKLYNRLLARKELEELELKLSKEKAKKVEVCINRNLELPHRTRHDGDDYYAEDWEWDNSRKQHQGNQHKQERSIKEDLSSSSKSIENDDLFYSCTGEIHRFFSFCGWLLL